jgi:hypothetical protein
MNVEIITILDRSGSMAGLRNDVIGGYNGFMAEQKTVDGRARATLVQFCSAVETLYQGVDIQHVGVLTLENYVPLGSTALYDAIGMALNEQRQRIAKQAWADKVLVNIITDGEDNASREFTQAKATRLITECQQNAGWTFLFQAANIDAFQTATSFGISAASTRAFAPSAAGVAEAYGSMSFAATTLRTSA